MKAKKDIMLRLPTELSEQLDLAANKHKRSRSNMIEVILTEWIKANAT